MAAGAVTDVKDVDGPFPDLEQESVLRMTLALEQLPDPPAKDLPFGRQRTAFWKSFEGNNGIKKSLTPAFGKLWRVLIAQPAVRAVESRASHPLLSRSRNRLQASTKRNKCALLRGW